MPLYKKRLRLPERDYLGRRVYFITICTENRATFFLKSATAYWILEELIATAAQFTFALHAYCIMPDHLHFLSEALADTCDLIKLVNGFKQCTAYEYSKTQATRLWQIRYYDHVLRSNDSIEDIACYIWWNPARKGLCAKPQEYAFSGSQTIDWMKCISIAPRWTPPWKQAVGAGLQPGV